MKNSLQHVMFYVHLDQGLAAGEDHNATVVFYLVGQSEALTSNHCGHQTAGYVGRGGGRVHTHIIPTAIGHTPTADGHTPPRGHTSIVSQMTSAPSSTTMALAGPLGILKE